MKRAWQIQEAKNKLSEVVEEAVHHGPQVITKRGVEVAVMLSYVEYRKMISSQKKLSDFFSRVSSRRGRPRSCQRQERLKR